MEEALSVRFLDHRNFTSIWEYVQIGMPNVVIIILDWACFQIMVVIAGYIGVNQQACQIILLGIINVLF